MTLFRCSKCREAMFTPTIKDRVIQLWCDICTARDKR